MNPQAAHPAAASGSPDDEPVRTRARALAQDLARGTDDAPPADIDPEGAEALGWALKDEAIAAWGTAPARAQRCAALLAELARRDAAPVVAALADWTAGLAAASEGRMADAAASLDAARERFEHVGQTRAAAQTQVPMIMALSVLGRHDEAQRCAEAALRRFVEVGDQTSAGKVELNLGILLARRDRHAESALWCRRAAVRAARAGDRELSIRADIALANALTWQFEFDEALRINERARMRSQTYGYAVLQAHAHQAIGRLELHRGHWPGALRELALAARLAADSGSAAPQRVEAEAALADAYLAVHLLPEARALFDQVIHEALRLEDPAEHAWALLQRSRVDSMLGDEHGARQALAHAGALYAEQDNAVALAWVDLALAEIDLAQGKLAAALERSQRAAKRFGADGIRGWWLQARALAAQARLGLGHVDAAREDLLSVLADSAGIAPVQAVAHRALGALELGAGALPRARDHLSRALSTVDVARAALPGDLFRSAIAAQSEHAHDLLVRLTLDAGDAAESVLEQIDQGRARALALAFDEPPDGSDPATAPQVEAERTALRWSRNRWHEAVASGDATAAARLAADVLQRESALLEVARRDALTRAPQTPSGTGPRATLRSADLQACLAPDQGMVVYHRLGDDLAACVVSARSITVRRWSCEGLDARIQALRFQIDALRHGSRRLRGHAVQLLQRARHHAQALHAIVWQPLADLVEPLDRVVIVPHRALHYVPFAALHDGRRWLVERHAPSVAPSASLWQRLAMQPARRLSRALAVAFGAGLAQAEGEAAAVAGIFGGQGRLLCGPAATQSALRTHAADVDVLHLACHGQFRADSPMFSSLELADGPFTLHDAQGIATRAGLVALSACETGVSRVAPGDESIGLVRAFLVAGAPTVLASQWPVDDASTAELMRGFYVRLTAHGDAAVALAVGQREAARDGVHPFHWAPFVLHGRT